MTSSIAHIRASRKYRQLNRGICNQRNREWNKSANGIHIRGEWESANGKDYRRAYYRRKRQEALNILGGMCTCCGENKYEFLAFDHKNGDGQKDRKAGIVCHGLFAEVRKNPKRFQVLCHNCNMAYGRYGYCPHKSDLA